MKIKVFIGVLIAMVTPQFLFAQNTFSLNGNVDAGTSTPSERLDVNGDMVVDASLRVKDSLRVDKDLRTKGRLTEGQYSCIENEALKLKTDQ